ncbi:hypothetical protein BDN72DRAFT_906684 [Pluteus cervinus]|uniref:Uncharacterized protein n=1 Tax=Pluteus cervinus TaxID=181527 RepID=A0ACD2ZYL4_9AGAR|nr:hypothetical protein BDN72DRAFT_906684 [Pluteus cervinus]
MLDDMEDEDKDEQSNDSKQKKGTRRGGCKDMPGKRKRDEDGDDDDTQDQPDKKKRAKRNSLHPSRTDSSRSKRQYGAFPATWQGVVDSALDYAHLLLTVQDAFPGRELSQDFARQALDFALRDHADKGLLVEDAWFNDGGKENMLHYIRNDRSTWHSTLRVGANTSALSHYNFGNQKRAQVVAIFSIRAILALFQHPALFDHAVNFYYMCHQLEWLLKEDTAFSLANYKNTYSSITIQLHAIKAGTFVAQSDSRLSTSERSSLAKRRQKQLKAFRKAISAKGQKFLNTP